MTSTFGVASHSSVPRIDPSSSRRVRASKRGAVAGGLPGCSESRAAREGTVTQRDGTASASKLSVQGPTAQGFVTLPPQVGVSGQRLRLSPRAPVCGAQRQSVVQLEHCLCAGRSEPHSQPQLRHTSQTPLVLGTMHRSEFHARSILITFPVKFVYTTISRAQAAARTGPPLCPRTSGEQFRPVSTGA